MTDPCIGNFILEGLECRVGYWEQSLKFSLIVRNVDPLFAAIQAHHCTKVLAKVLLFLWFYL